MNDANKWIEHEKLFPMNKKRHLYYMKTVNQESSKLNLFTDNNYNC